MATSCSREPLAGRLLSCREAAQQLNVSADYIRRLVRAGHLSAIRIGKRSLRVLGDSIDRYIETRSEANRLVCQGAATWSLQTAKSGSDGVGGAV